MADLEVERLRRLRGSALRLRAVARALPDNRRAVGQDLVNQGRLAAWRVARTVSGWLRAHPYARYQRDAGVFTVLTNGLVAAVTSLTATSRRRALSQFGMRLRAVLREIDDARALTRSADLSDSFGRSQREFRAVLMALEYDALNSRESRPVSSAGPMSDTATLHEGSPFLTI